MIQTSVSFGHKLEFWFNDWSEYWEFERYLTHFHIARWTYERKVV